MIYYTVKNKEFKKKDIVKEYKTIDGALKAASKDDSLHVFDQQGIEIKKEPQESDQEPQASDQEPQESDQEPKDVILHKVTVCVDGSLILRRTASFEIENECGRAVKGQTYVADSIFEADGKEMLHTIDGLYMSAAKDHVKIEEM